ncbi:MAG: hypothetical protein OEW58_13075 [Gammaproteobacteria bacterium]|nr:hypothetical protein [Gammaproteobacteria bacterium]
MPAFYQAVCDCGYKIDGLVDGLNSHGENWAIAQCCSCNQMISVSDHAAYSHCAHEYQLFACPCCGSADIFLIPDLDSSLHCPKCKHQTLQLHETGVEAVVE